MVLLNEISEKNGSDEFTVRNANYRKVISLVERFTPDNRYEFCRCERCLSDIIALALNYLPPHYYVDADMGSEIGSPWVMIEGAVIEAMDTVGKNPRHQK